MCDRKASQSFFQDGAAPEPGRVLLVGPGRLTDVLSTAQVTVAAPQPLLMLRDGLSMAGKVLFSLSPIGQHFFGGMNLEFQEGLWMESTPGAGPLFGRYTIAGYIEDRSPDPIAAQLDAVRAAVLDTNRNLAGLKEYLGRLYTGDPAA